MMKILHIYSQADTILKKIRQQSPVVHQITNYVTAKDCANIVLALGGSPIMADAHEELYDIVKQSNALVINIGTLNEYTRESVYLASRHAEKLGVPVVLDPVGAGASTFRTDTIHTMLSSAVPTVIRGNISEIRSVARLSSHTLGVDAADIDGLNQVEEHIDIACNLSKELGCIIAITGECDIISDGTSTAIVNNGHSMLTHITGTGCMSTAIVGACCGVTNDYFSATVTALLCQGIAGELASKTSSLGMYHVGLFDAMSNMSGSLISQRGKLHVK